MVSPSDLRSEDTYRKKQGMDLITEDMGLSFYKAWEVSRSKFSFVQIGQTNLSLERQSDFYSDCTWISILVYPHSNCLSSE